MMVDGGGRPEIALARAEFLAGSSDIRRSGVAGHVLASWERCVSRGVPQTAIDNQFFSELDLAGRTVRCAEPVIDRLVEQLADIPMCVALTDSNARLLARRDGNRSFGRVTDRVNFAQGFGYAEDSVGTNGVGTVLESGHSVHIVGAEHYHDSLQDFACAGAPVRDPFTGRIEGVLDISCLAVHSTPVLHSLVRSAAAAIEQNLVADRDESHQALFDLYSRVDARARDGVFAIGPRLTMFNHRLSLLLDGAERETLQDHVRFLMQHHTSVDDHVDLPSGRRVRLRATAVPIGGGVAGMVGVVGPVTVPGPGVPLVRARPAGAEQRPHAVESSSAGWLRAVATVENALAGGESVMVFGEPGSGRFDLVEQVHHRLSPDGQVVAVAPTAVVRDPAGVLRMIADGHRSGVLHVLRDLHEAPAGAAARLADLVADLDDPPRLVATSTTTDGGGGPAGSLELLGVFTVSATVPPLRNRTADLPALVRALLDDLAPHREVRLARDAQQVIAAFDWPGNVRQLRSALAAALQARPVGTIEVADLPPYCQSTLRTPLRWVDQAERDAVVAALREAGGNRKAAAVALGLARSTLYRKIKQYGITD
ncbi:Fis family transcriptional regulator [Pseudonocardia sp. ICBG1122]|nr:Fis family transcriptional regulator [Pseudonocardia pini]